MLQQLPQGLPSHTQPWMQHPAPLQTAAEEACCSSPGGMATARHRPLSQQRPWVPDSVEQQLSVSALQIASLERRRSLLEQSQGSASEPPDPQGFICPSFLLGYNHRAATKGVREVPAPQVNHIQTSSSSWLVHKTKHRFS